MLSLLLSFFFFPPPLKIDGQASLPFGKRLGNDSSRKHPPGYPASVPPHRQITPRRQQWAKQCNSRFIVSRAGYELRKLAESRGGVRLLYHVYAIPRAGPTRKPLASWIRRCNDTAVAQPARKDRRKNGQELVPRERSIQLSVSRIAQTTSQRMIYERSNAVLRVSADRFVKSIWISMGFSRFLQNSTLFFFLQNV